MATARFAIGSPDGPHATVWRLWTVRKGDVYLAGRATAGKLKVSFHVSGDWRVAVTKENVDGPDPLIDPRLGRLIQRWPRPREFTPGLTHAAQIGTAGVDVDSPPTKSATGKIEWVDPPSHAEVGIFDVMLSRLPVIEGDWPGREGMGTGPIFHAELATGEVVWILWRTQRAAEDFWVTREQAVRQSLPPHGSAPQLDSVTPTSRALLGGEFQGRAMLIDVSLTVVERQRIRHAGALWTP
jgi:hypothetical protein